MWKGPCTKEYRQFLEAEKGRGQMLPPEPPEGTSLANTLTLSQWDWLWTSDIQSCKVINMCCMFVVIYGMGFPAMW